MLIQRTALLSMFLGLMMGFSQIPQPNSLAQAEYVPGELIVGVNQLESALALQAMEFVGRIKEENPALNFYVVKLAPQIKMESATEFLNALPGVRYVEPNYIYRILATPNDPSYGQQYGPQRIQANLAWDSWTPQRTTHIAIVDTGIDSNHPDLTNKMRRLSNGAVYGYNTVNNTTNALDDNGHGTHCAGIAAAQINNGVGIAGVAGWNPSNPNAQSFIQLMPVKVLDANGSGSLSNIARGITWAADNGAHVISMSLGGSSSSQTLADAVTYAWNRGCLLVAAAGNSGSSSPLYPAYYTNVIAVAATDSSDRLASFSQFGSWVNIAAPGVAILSTIPNNRYASYDGTSMACPHVAGAAALIWAQYPNLSNQQLRSLLEQNVDPYQPYGSRTIAPNAGRLNVNKALLAAGGGGSTPPELSGFTISPTSVTAGTNATGTVTLSAPAPSGGFVVNISSSNPSVASAPSSVTVAQGQTSASFTITTASVSSSTTVTFTASANGISRQANLTVNPAQTSVTLESLTISPTSVWGGSTATGTVTLSGPAPSGGAVVQLRSSNSTRASVPSSVTVPAGARSVNFTIRTTSRFSITTVTITATYNGTSRSAQITVWF
ncbi:MAG: S8 family serine peptidase [Fimbriimonadales bacterium]